MSIGLEKNHTLNPDIYGIVGKFSEENFNESMFFNPGDKVLSIFTEFVLAFLFGHGAFL